MADPVSLLKDIGLAALPFLTGLLANATETLADYLLPLENENNRRQRAALIQGLGGNDFPDLLLRINQLIQDALEKSQPNVEQLLVTQTIWQHYHQIQACLNEINLKYLACARHPNNRTAVDAFVKYVAEERDPMAQADLLFKCITNPGYGMSHTGRNLMDDLIASSTLERFIWWQNEIRLTFTQAYAIKMDYHYRILKTAIADRVDQRKQEELRELAHADLDSMVANNEWLSQLLAVKLSEMKNDILLKPETDELKRTYPKEMQKSCAIGLKVEALLKENQKLDNPSLAKCIAKTLRNDYTQFAWAVVVLDNYKNAVLQLNPEHGFEFYHHRFGSRPASPGRPGMTFGKLLKGDSERVVRDDLVMSGSKGGYGHMVCYRQRNDRNPIGGFTHEKAALLFWVDRELVGSDLVRTCTELQTHYANDVKLREESSGKANQTVHQIIRNLAAMEMNFVFGLSLDVPSDNPSEELIGFSAASVNNAEFPIRLGGTNSCVLIWPEPSTRVINGSLKLSQGGAHLIALGSRYSCYRTQLMTDAVTVVYKEIPLQHGSSSVNDRERKIQIALLDSHMGLRLMNFKNDNVVRFFGFQVWSPQPHERLKPHTYRVIMESLEGGSLKDWVEGSNVTVSQIHDYGLQILNGLSYLHQNGLAHHDFHGGHVMFQGPTPGHGLLKIISIGRIREILPLQTFNKPELSVYLPAHDMQSGRLRKKDVWSFGSVIIQMVLGVEPTFTDLKVEDVDKQTHQVRMPQIPHGLPLALEEIVRACLTVKYDLRPTADAVSRMQFFCTKDYETIDWTCPKRIEEMEE